MPCLGLMPFLRIWDTVSSVKNMCVNALYRALAFSTNVNPMNCFILSKCQCPISGSCLFYEKKEERERNNYNVSMPYIGLLPFLRHHSGSLDFTGYNSDTIPGNYLTI